MYYIKTFSLFIEDSKGNFFRLNNKIHKLEVSQKNTKYFKIRYDFNTDEQKTIFKLQGILKNEEFTESILNVKLFELFMGEYKEILNQNIPVRIY